jgi:hypothetical protein
MDSSSSSSSTIPSTTTTGKYTMCVHVIGVDKVSQIPDTYKFPMNIAFGVDDHMETLTELQQGRQKITSASTSVGTQDDEDEESSRQYDSVVQLLSDVKFCTSRTLDDTVSGIPQLIIIGAGGLGVTQDTYVAITNKYIAAAAAIGKTGTRLGILILCTVSLLSAYDILPLINRILTPYRKPSSATPVLQNVPQLRVVVYSCEEKNYQSAYDLIQWLRT